MKRSSVMISSMSLRNVFCQPTHRNNALAYRAYWNLIWVPSSWSACGPHPWGTPWPTSLTSWSTYESTPDYLDQWTPTDAAIAWTVWMWDIPLLGLLLQLRCTDYGVSTICSPMHAQTLPPRPCKNMQSGTPRWLNLVKFLSLTLLLDPF